MKLQKLPGLFVLDTPLGKYNLNWAVLIDIDVTEKLYLILEIKGSILEENLRVGELSKIACGHKHFDALGNDVTFEETDNFKAFINNLN